MENRQWLLAQHPQGSVGRECFCWNVASDPAGQGGPGQVLMRWELLLCAPTIRNWISGNRGSFHPVVELGQPILAPAIGQIIESNNADFSVGMRLFGTGSWQDQQWVDPAAGYMVIAEKTSSVDAMGVLGINALTAYCGLMRLGEPKEGDVLLVSGAAGSVGSIVAQIGRIKGCKVIGIAGGPDKLAWLRDECGINQLIDYKAGDVAAQMDALCSDGIDIYFDNVGGDILVAAAARMRQHGRIVLCGQISTYDSGEAITAPPIDMMRLIYGGIRMQGFLVRHHPDCIQPGLEDLAKWDEQGLLAHREDIRDGLERLPETLTALFDGSNKGTLLARIADAAGAPV